MSRVAAGESELKNGGLPRTCSSVPVPATNVLPKYQTTLTRTVIGDVYCGYQIPEYTTYSEVLSVFKRLLPIPTALEAQDDYKLNITELKKAAKILSLSVIVASNPRNPTGQVIQGDDLKELVRMGDGNTTWVTCCSLVC